MLLSLKSSQGKIFLRLLFYGKNISRPAYPENSIENRISKNVQRFHLNSKLTPISLCLQNCPCNLLYNPHNYKRTAKSITWLLDTCHYKKQIQ